jgi:hypothetical protein
MSRASLRRHRFLLVLLVILGIGAISISVKVRETGATYYVDDASGHDAASGTSPATAWKSLNKVNRTSLKPGDRVLLKRGSVFNEQLRATWNGSASEPIVIDAYGSGPAPVIQNQHDGNIRVTGSYLSIGNLTTTNSPASYGAVDPASPVQPVGWVVGINLVGAHHVTIHNMTITHEAVAVAFTQSTHDNRVLNSQLVNNDGAWKPSTDQNGIRGGTGVLLEGTNNEIGQNTFSGNSTLVNAESISIELYTAASSLIHYNSSTDKVFVETGSDRSFTSRDNQILFNQFSATQWNNPVFVNTRGVGDKFGPVYSTIVVNNSVYVTGRRATGVVCSKCGPEILTLRNNIIVAQFKAVYVDTAQPVEDHNLFWSPAETQNAAIFTQNLDRSSTDLVANPMFVDAASGDFRLRADSPAVGRGAMRR